MYKWIRVLTVLVLLLGLFSVAPVAQARSFCGNTQELPADGVIVSDITVTATHSPIQVSIRNVGTRVSLSEIGIQVAFKTADATQVKYIRVLNEVYLAQPPSYTSRVDYSIISGPRDANGMFTTPDLDSRVLMHNGILMIDTAHVFFSQCLGQLRYQVVY